jgi:prolyl 4-hydroxylase
LLNAKTVNNFLTPEECNKILNFVKSVEPWENGGAEFWVNRTLNARSIYANHNPEIGKLLYDIREKVAESIKSLYQLPNIYPDLFQVVRWFPGMEQPPHADDMTNAKSENENSLDWFAHREYGAIIYLNDNYNGGHTYYPNHNFDIKPEAGKLAVHPGNPEHLHGVTKVSDEIRYTLASFWTQDKEYFDQWVL